MKRKLIILLRGFNALSTNAPEVLPLTAPPSSTAVMENPSPVVSENNSQNTTNTTINPPVSPPPVVPDSLPVPHPISIPTSPTQININVVQSNTVQSNTSMLPNIPDMSSQNPLGKKWVKVNLYELPRERQQFLKGLQKLFVAIEANRLDDKPLDFCLDSDNCELFNRITKNNHKENLRYPLLLLILFHLCSLFLTVIAATLGSIPLNTNVILSYITLFGFNLLVDSLWDYNTRYSLSRLSVNFVLLSIIKLLLVTLVLLLYSRGFFDINNTQIYNNHESIFSSIMDTDNAEIRRSFLIFSLYSYLVGALFYQLSQKELSKVFKITVEGIQSQCYFQKDEFFIHLDPSKTDTPEKRLEGILNY